jgi:type IX secretion system PorP/SprF family membrane protein
MKNSLFTWKCCNSKWFVLFAVIVLTKQLKAQNEPIVAHFLYHTHVFNPATAGNVRDITVSALARQQWVGFKEAPSTQLLNAYGYIPKAKSGVGLVFVNDRVGKEGSISLRASYAYCQKINDKARLSFGLSFGFLNRYVKGDQYIYDETGDLESVNNRMNRWKPYVGAGVEFNGYNFTAGFSVTNIDQPLKRATTFRVPMHYFGYAKYSWDVNSNVNFTPGVFVRSAGFITQAEINACATFKKRVTAALFYRTVDAAGAMLGVYIVKGLLVSYSYDFDFGKLSRHQSGSHEVNLIYRFGGANTNDGNYKSPRYAN